MQLLSGVARDSIQIQPQCIRIYTSLKLYVLLPRCLVTQPSDICIEELQAQSLQVASPIVHAYTFL